MSRNSAELVAQADSLRATVAWPLASVAGYQPAPQAHTVSTLLRKCALRRRQRSPVARALVTGLRLALACALGWGRRFACRPGIAISNNFGHCFPVINSRFCFAS